jgi:glutamyl-tRNA reductase
MLTLLGVNHRSAPLPFRERLGFSEQEIPATLRELVEGSHFEEMMILSTCNRVEFLVRPRDGEPCARAIREFLVGRRDVSLEEIDRYTYVHDGLEAVRHVFRVASGLDSMVLGEPQILGQVKRAYSLARENGATGPVLEHLLQQGLAAAKRVRTETGISRHAVSVAYAAVTLARKIFGELENRPALLLGAGKMSELAARHLVGHGVAPLLVANRTYSRADDLAREFRGTAVPWDQAFDQFEKVDIVVTGTAASEPVVRKERVQKAMRARRSRPLFFVDIAVPRDVETSVNDLDNVYVYDVDDLQGVVDSSLEERKRSAEHAGQLLEAEVRAFDLWRQSRLINPTIAALSQRLHTIGKDEFTRLRRKMGSLSPEQERAIDELTHAIAQKVLHPAVRHLRHSLRKGEAAERASLYEAIFSLDVSPSAVATEQEKEEPADTIEAPRGPRRVLRGGKE